MNRLLLAALVTLLLPWPARSQAQVHLQINLGLPPQPPLVVVQPGIQVVENWNEEVFFVGGWYWVRRDGGWYRARSPRASFVWVERRHVPPGLVRIPPGQYKHYHRHQAKAERKAYKNWEKSQRHPNKHGGGHGHDRD